MVVHYSLFDAQGWSERLLILTEGFEGLAAKV